MKILCLLCILLNEVYSLSKCNEQDNRTCTCIGGEQIHCPNEETVPKMVFRMQKEASHEILSIECEDVTKFDMNLVPNITLEEITNCSIETCPWLPLKEVFDHFSMNAVEFFKFKHSNIFIDKDFLGGLQTLKGIQFSYLHLKHLDQEVFSSGSFTSIDISNCHNVTLTPQIFRNLSALKYLYLDADSIEIIPEDLFASLSSLVSLNLKQNKIKSIQDTAFKGLINLTRLDLNRNQIELISENALENLPKLELLCLAGNRIKTLPSNFFVRNQKLQTVILDYNNQLQLSDNFFGNSLRLVNLPNCNLSVIPSYIFNYSLNIEEIHLERNHLQVLPQTLFHKLKKLKIVHLQKNLIQKISVEHFKDLVSLKELYLQHNNITKIEAYTFDNTKIRILNLSFNSYKGGEIFNDVRELEHIDFSHNLIQNLTMFKSPIFQKLIYLNLCHNLITTMELTTLNTSKNVSVNLDSNKLRKVTTNFLGDLPAITTLSFIDNPFDCNCENYEFYQFYQHRINKQYRERFVFQENSFNCTTPIELKGKLLKDLQPEQFVCDLEQNCPEKCLCYWRPSDKNVIINCSNRNLSELPIIGKNLTSTGFEGIELNLDRNKFKQVSLKKIPYNITKLNLSHNYIEKIDGLPRIKVLDLSYNKITSINPNLLQTLESTIVTAGYNPWICDCSAVNLTNFLRTQKKILDSNHFSCNNKNQTLLLNLTEADLCISYFLYYLLSLLCVIFLILLLSLVLFYRYNQEIKIWLYSRNLCMWYITEDKLDKNKKYDVFISYSHHDEDFVVQNLLPVLETSPNPYKVCIHYREWIPGEFITTQVTKSVLESKRTLIVLSENFLESVWGKLEFRTAHSQALVEGRTKVIIVVYGNINEEKLDEELRAYMRTNTYVKWEDPYFWNKIKYALPHKKVTLDKQQKIVNVVKCIDDTFNTFHSKKLDDI